MRINRVTLITEMAKKDLKLNDLASLTGIHKATLSAVKNGKSCSEDTASKIAKALEVPVSELLKE